MAIGIEVVMGNFSRTAVLSNGVVTFSLDAVNGPDRAFSEVVLTGSEPVDVERYGWMARRLEVGAELIVRVVERSQGDPPDHIDKKAEPLPTVAGGIEAAKERTRKKIAELQLELEELEKWDSSRVE